MLKYGVSHNEVACLNMMDKFFLLFVTEFGSVCPARFAELEPGMSLAMIWEEPI